MSLERGFLKRRIWKAVKWKGKHFWGRIEMERGIVLKRVKCPLKQEEIDDKMNE